MPFPALAPSLPHHVLLVPGVVHGANARIAPPPIPTGIAALDTLLGGGLPRGVLTEIVGSASSGRTTLACALLRAVTATRALVACVDLPDAFDPAHAVAAGIDLARLLWIKPRTRRDAVQAAAHVVDAEGFGLVLVDLDDGRALPFVPPARHVPRERPLSSAIWIRLARAAARTRTAIVLLGHENVAGTFAAVRLELERRGTVFESQGTTPAFMGITSAVHLRKSKVAMPPVASTPVIAAAGP